MPVVAIADLYTIPSAVNNVMSMVKPQANYTRFGIGTQKRVQGGGGGGRET